MMLAPNECGGGSGGMAGATSASQREFLDDLLDELGFREIAEELERRIQGGKVHAFHWTKEPEPDCFKALRQVPAKLGLSVVKELILSQRVSRRQ